MKKRFAFLLVLVLICSVLPVWAQETAPAGLVEIQFCVGDSTLLINGNEVAVETPYVVGDGVTLVPLRVITEAFGAEVGWIEETQTITLKYPGVEIVLQIGNPIAEVNGVAETLLAAPELPNSSTMVPLRFISETFGATVAYDEATERITVTKTATSGETVMEGAINAATIGDSYFDWSMDNPKDFTMDERSFDGTFTAFSYDDDNWFCILYGEKKEDANFEKTFSSVKDSLSDMTLVKADKGTTDDGVQYMHFQAKDKKTFLNTIVYSTETQIIMLDAEFSIENSEIREKGLAYMDSFALKYEGSDIYDLSNVKDGWRTFKSEGLKLSFNVPADMIMLSDEDVDGKYEFGSPDEELVPRISFSVTSKSDGKSAADLALYDFAHNKKYSNEKLFTFSGGVTEASYAGFKAYEYAFTCKSEAHPYMSRDVFFELGEYIYNMRIDLPLDPTAGNEKMNSIFNSIKAEQLNPDEVGILLRNYPTHDEKYEEKTEGYTMQLPTSIKPVSGVYVDSITGLGFMVASEKNATMSKKVLEEKLNLIYKSVKKANQDVISRPNITEVNGRMVGSFVLASEKDGKISYDLYYLTLNNGVHYHFIASVPEDTYAKGTLQVFEDIVSSIETVK
ncbi:MAG: copper amine oxidase N-terminal domain-containing protein [Clostridia bacterium]|nr:copper amine oxidase N-terminal domain-containing protein [Clostridia bacterium]